MWDSLVGDMSTPSHELVHSHDFARYLTTFKAVWDPKDDTETTLVCGRYISEDFAGLFSWRLTLSLSISLPVTPISLLYVSTFLEHSRTLSHEFRVT